MREYLEKHYSEELAASRREVEKLAVKALLEVVQSGIRSIELAVMPKGGPLTVRHPQATHATPSVLASYALCIQANIVKRKACASSPLPRCAF